MGPFKGKHHLKIIYYQNIWQLFDWLLLLCSRPQRSLQWLCIGRFYHVRGSVLSSQGRKVQHVIQTLFDVGMRGVACSANTAYLLLLALSSHDLEHDRIYAALKCPLCNEKSKMHTSICCARLNYFMVVIVRHWRLGRLNYSLCVTARLRDLITRVAQWSNSRFSLT